MTQVASSQAFKYPTAIVAFIGGLTLMSIVGLVQVASLGFSHLTLPVLVTSFLLGAGITLFVARLLQQRVDSLRNDLQHEFDQRTDELRKTEARFHEYAGSSSDWFWETDAENRFVFFSSHLYGSMGISSEDVLGKRREDLRIAVTNPEEEEHWENYLRCVEQQLPFKDFEYRVRLANGKEVLVRSTGKPYYDNDGNYLGYRGTGSNAIETISEELRQQYRQELIYNATAVLHDGFYLFDADRRLIFCNPRLKEICNHISDLLEPGAHYEEVFAGAIEKQMEFSSEEAKQAWIVERQQHWKDEIGTPFDLNLKDGVRIRLVEQRLPGGELVGLCVDVTESRRIQDELDEAQRIAAIGSFRWDVEQDRLISCSKEYARFFDFSLDEQKSGSPSWQEYFIYPEDLGRVKAAYKASDVSGEVTEVEYRFQSADGKVGHVLERLTPSLWRDGEVVEQIGTLQEVTESRRAEAELEAAQHIANVGSFRWNPVNSRMISCSDGFARIFGRPKAELLAMIEADIFYAIHPDDLEQARRDFARADSVDGLSEISFRIVRPNGDIRYVVERGDTSVRRFGKVIEQLWTAQDVTDSRRIEAELEAAQRIAKVGSYRWSKERDRLLTCSSEYARIYGMTVEQILTSSDQHLLGTVHPDDVERVEEAYERANVVDGGYEIEFRLLRPDGEVRYVAELGDVSVRRDGKVIEQLGTLQDVTKSKRIEAELDEAQRISNVGSYRTDFVNDILVSFSPQLARIYGLSADDFDPNNPFMLEIVHPEDRELVDSTYQKARLSEAGQAGEFLFEIEYRVMRADGEVRNILERADIAKVTDGKVTEVIGTLQDVTERKQVEFEKQKNEEMLEAAIQNVPGGFLVVNSDGIIERFNRQFFDLYPKQQFFINEGVPFERFVRHGIEVGVYQDALEDPEGWLQQRLLLHKTESFEALDRLTDGRWIQIALRGLQNGTRVGIYIDVTELQQARESAERANQSKSDFLASMSHELRTPMHGILSFTELGLKRLDSLSQEKLRQYLENIHVSGTRLLYLLNDLLDLSKVEAGKMQLDLSLVNLADLIKYCINEQDLRLRKKNLNCVFDPVIDNSDCACDRNRIIQVMTNIIANAIRFSPETGEIQIDLERYETGFRVRVSDQGPGIPALELDEVFDKFYQSSSNRNQPGSTGLGLSVCREIIELHQGRIWAESNPRQGTSILFEIPSQQARD